MPILKLPRYNRALRTQSRSQLFKAGRVAAYGAAVCGANGKGVDDGVIADFVPGYEGVCHLWSDGNFFWFVKTNFESLGV